MLIGPPAGCWAHGDTDPYNFDLHWEMYELRRRGYVMWDLGRCEQVTDRTEYWEDSVLMDDEEPTPPPVSLVAVEKSYKRRTEIWQQGGQGWWSAEDESRVVWSGEKRVVEADVQGSQSEA